ncbi:MAG: hypothetical protein ACR2J4_07005 [Deinococcus sp.]
MASLSAQAASQLRSSALPRPLDPSVPSNRFALLGTGAALLLALLAGRGWRASLGVGGAAFLGWASARELDPDAPLSASLALGLSGLGALLGGSPKLLPGYTVLSGLRVLAGTVGPAASDADALALSAGAALSRLGGQETAALLPAGALWLSGRQSDGLQPPAWAAPLAAGAGLLAPGRRSTSQDHTVLSDLLSLAALGTAGVLLRPEEPSSRQDQTSRRVSGSRVHSARLLSLAALGLGLLRGQSASLLPLAAACLGTALRRGLALEPGKG